jgi:hypothetical protein
MTSQPIRLRLSWDWGVTYGLWERGLVDDVIGPELSEGLRSDLNAWVRHGQRAMELLAAERHQPGYNRTLAEGESGTYVTSAEPPDERDG